MYEGRVPSKLMIVKNGRVAEDQLATFLIKRVDHVDREVFVRAIDQEAKVRVKLRTAIRKEEFEAGHHLECRFEQGAQFVDDLFSAVAWAARVVILPAAVGIVDEVF